MKLSFFAAWKINGRYGNSSFDSKEKLLVNGIVRRRKRKFDVFFTPRRMKVEGCALSGRLLPINVRKANFSERRWQTYTSASTQDVKIPSLRRDTCFFIMPFAIDVIFLIYFFSFRSR